MPADTNLTEVLRRACEANPSGPIKGARRSRFTDVLQDVPVEQINVAVWVLDLLVNLIKPDDGVWLIGKDNPNIWRPLLAGGNDDPSPVVCVTRGRYITFTDVAGAFDAEEGVWVDTVPKRWLETRVFCVSELIRLGGEKLALTT